MPMHTAHVYVQELKASKEFFDRATRALIEEDSEFSPEEGMMSAAQQVAHVAQTLEWFLDGATNPKGFDLDFDAHMAAVKNYTSLAKAREWHTRAHEKVTTAIGAMSEETLCSFLPEGMVMGGMPRAAVVGAMVEHTAHHRGALSVYTRLLGKEPPMPYMDL
ncbi:MAG: hypothetical protein AMXMBFR84_15910 [Candidatus Hydrogenedentota bacterium]